MVRNLTAIILAGGKSSRMGQDKALIPIGGVPMLELVCRAAQSCADTVYIVTSWEERYQHLVSPSVKFIREVPLPGKIEMSGPLVGFAQGLLQVQTDWVLLLACDLAKLSPKILQEWTAELDQVDEEAIATLVHHVKGWEPLCGFYRRRCLLTLTDFINQGGRSFQQWLQQQKIQPLLLLEPEMLTNYNTPDSIIRSN